jgi:class 3 adenylate cyclase
MGTLFLQENDATILLADLLDFTQLTKKRGATVELAITLSRFYEHVASVAKAHGGRVVKLCGDGVLCAFVGITDHRARALRALRQLVEGREAFNETARLTRMPEVDYTVVCTSGRVLAGDLGADKLQGFDVIGEAVNRAFRLSHLAPKRKVTNLIEAATYEGAPAAVPCAPIEPADLDGEEIKLVALST